MATNPFSVPNQIPEERGIFGNAKRTRGGFLFRVIEFDDPFPCKMIYDGWWFRQKVHMNGQRAWSQISWLTIEREAEFQVPPSVAAAQPRAKIEINFGRSLLIRRFRLWIDGQIVYDEIN